MRRFLSLSFQVNKHPWNAALWRRRSQRSQQAGQTRVSRELTVPSRVAADHHRRVLRCIFSIQLGVRFATFAVIILFRFPLRELDLC